MSGDHRLSQGQFVGASVYFSVEVFLPCEALCLLITCMLSGAGKNEGLKDICEDVRGSGVSVLSPAF